MLASPFKGNWSGQLFKNPSRALHQTPGAVPELAPLLAVQVLGQPLVKQCKLPGLDGSLGCATTAVLTSPLQHLRADVFKWETNPDLRVTLVTY